jgi:hypothetical protein
MVAWKNVGSFNKSLSRQTYEGAGYIRKTHDRNLINSKWIDRMVKYKRIIDYCKILGLKYLAIRY